MNDTSDADAAEHLTPPEVFESLGLLFDLDPCSPGAGRCFVPAVQHYTSAEDGLAQDWSTGLAWVHPPAHDTQRWLTKLADHGNGIALVTGSTHVMPPEAEAADVVCIMDSPVHFFTGSIAQRSDEGVAAILLAYGEKASKALAASGLGSCATNPTAPAASLNGTDQRQREHR